MQANTVQIWMARNWNIRQSVMLHSRIVHIFDEGVQCQSHQKLTPLCPIKWACLKVCPDCQNTVL